MDTNVAARRQSCLLSMTMVRRNFQQQSFRATCLHVRALCMYAEWAKRLVKYYSHFGFKPMYEVGDRGLADVPDMLVWGGVGTRMDADIESMLRRWSSSIRRRQQK
eukprot:scaffold373543_cov48-Prasinocladus_malaysianus.AAC.1